MAEFTDFALKAAHLRSPRRPRPRHPRPQQGRNSYSTHVVPHLSCRKIPYL